MKAIDLIFWIILTELRVISTVAGECGKSTCEPHDLCLMCQNIGMKDWNSSMQMDEQSRPEFLVLRFTNLRLKQDHESN